MTTTSNTTSMTAREWLMLLTLSSVWGGAFFFAAVAVTQVPPMTVVLARVGLAAICLWCVVVIFRVSVPRDTRIWGAFLVMGALNNAVPFTLLFWAQTGIGSGLASILNATTPLFTVIVAQFATGDERMTGPKVLGIVLGILGVAILIGRPAAQSPLWAQIAVLGAALSYGCATVFGKRFARLGVAPVMTATGQVTLSSAIMAPLVVWIDRPWAQPMPDASVLAAILALAVVSTAFAYLLFFRILRTAGATNLSLVTLLIPVSAVLLGALFLGEVLSGAQLAGMAVIGAGLLVMDGRLWRWVRS